MLGKNGVAGIRRHHITSTAYWSTPGLEGRESVVMWAAECGDAISNIIERVQGTEGVHGAFDETAYRGNLLARSLAHSLTLAGKLAV